MKTTPSASVTERFKLAFHSERRETQAYALVVAKNGPKMSRADASKCDPANSGLTEAFDLRLEWTREDPFGEPGATASPAIFTALHEQLGLKLESTKEPVETLVIDHAERPTEN
jgi:hypothetical protein